MPDSSPSTDFFSFSFSSFVPLQMVDGCMLTGGLVDSYSHFRFFLLFILTPACYFFFLFLIMYVFCPILLLVALILPSAQARGRRNRREEDKGKTFSFFPFFLSISIRVFVS